MEFINDEAAAFYSYLLKKHGAYIHINASAPLTVEALKEFEEFILQVKQKHQKEPKSDLDSYFDDIPW